MTTPRTAADAERSGQRVEITHVTTNHQPFDSRIFLKECRSLAAAGYRVNLVVPHGEALERDGVKIVPITVHKNRRERFLRSVWNAFRAARSTRARVFHLHDPDLLPIGWALRFLGRRVIYDAHEDRPKQVLSKAWIPEAARPIVAAATRLVESVSASIFDQVIAATPAIAETYPARKTTLVQNYPIVDELQPAEPRPYASRPNQVIFVGGMSAVRGVRQFVDAMALVPERLGPRLLLVGTFDDARFQAEVEARPGWDRTEHLGWQDRDAVARHLGATRVGLVTYLPEPNHVAAQPNKLFEYMSAGIPVVASDFPLWRSIVQGVGCGLLVDPARPEDVARAITWLLEHPEEAATMGARGQAAVSERLNWGTQSEVLLDLYARLTT